MTLFLEEEVDDVIDADDWSTIIADTRERQRNEIARKIAEFERNGGAIQEFAPGATAWPNGAFVFPSSHNMSKDEVKASRMRRENQFKATKESDLKAVEILRANIDTAVTAVELCQELGCSAERMHRLIRDYFPDDERCLKFSRRSHEQRGMDNSVLLLPKVKEAMAAGIIGINNIAQHCGVYWKRISELNKMYRLNIPKEPSGRKPPNTGLRCLNTTCEKPVHKVAKYCPHCGHMTAYGISLK